MNLKVACKIALTITILSVLLIITGYPLFYIPLTPKFHWIIIEKTIVGTAKLLLQSIGFLIFLLGIKAFLQGQLSNLKILFVIAGTHILLGTLITAISTLTFLDNNQDSFRFLFHSIMLCSMLLSGLCLSIFTFLQSSRILPLINLVRTILILNFISLIFTTINATVYRYWPDQNIGYCISSAMPLLGYLTYLTAVIVFLCIWLKQNPQPPMAPAEDTSPEPLPTLSAAHTLPIEE